MKSLQAQLAKHQSKRRHSDVDFQKTEEEGKRRQKEIDALQVFFRFFAFFGFLVGPVAYLHNRK